MEAIAAQRIGPRESGCLWTKQDIGVRVNHHTHLPPFAPHPYSSAKALHPWILTLDVNGQPHRWIGWQAACHYYSLNMVAWTAGDRDFRFKGGVSRVTGLRSEIITNSIIAIRGRALRSTTMLATPPLSNRELFHRDCQICAYCGQHFPSQLLTRDHITPVSRGGRDIWMNVVTACRPCNQRKSGRTPEQARMALLYAPYIPNKAEYLILCNRHILADQMDFLSRHLPRESRLNIDTTLTGS
ncbi:MAG: HNH endonuclease [Zoogloeaceae bacterium]|nr:HNH endonuclease [Zoogloeaceae bacterium]